jgi:single-strand DNA-binding protein
MAGVVKINLIGNLGRDPETRYLPSGAMNVSFTLAVSRSWTDQSGQRQERTTWFNVTAWRRLAETLDGLAQKGYLKKGKQVFVSASRVEARTYQDRNGQWQASLDVEADELQLLGTRGDSEGEAYSEGSQTYQQPRRPREEDALSKDFDDVPF